uniref:Uncharacterized protein n=1 Tax=Panagrolaimus davidi TaxID=227884 RepID=A0A914PX83_9BILA
MLELINPKHLTIVEELRGNDTGSNFIVTKRFRYRRLLVNDKPLYLPPFSSVIFKCAEICLVGITLFPQEFLRLLSVKVRHIKCVGVRLWSTLTFSDIIKAAPNIEYFDFCDDNLETGYSWPEDILKWKNGKNLQYLKILIHDINFNVKCLADVIEVRKFRIF